MKDELFLIDINNLMYRFHFAFIKNPLRNKEGFNTSAIFGIGNFIMDLKKQYNAQYIAGGLDLKGKTFRHEEFEDYKSGRENIPDELAAQIPHIISLLEALDVSVVSKQGYEADDVIGSLKEQLSKDFDKIYIITSDKDVGQLLDDKCEMLYPKKDNGEYPKIDREKLAEKLGISMDRILDYYALIGDKSDAIPGIKGIGPKTAQKILSSIEDITDKTEIEENIDNERIRNKLLENTEQVRQYRELVRIRTDLELDISKDDLKCSSIDRDAVKEIASRFELYSMLKDLDIDTGRADIDLSKIDELERDEVLESDTIVLLSIDNKTVLASGKGYAVLDDALRADECSGKTLIIHSLKEYKDLQPLIGEESIYDLRLLSDIYQRNYSYKSIAREFAGIMETEDEKYAVIIASVSDKLIEKINSSPNYSIYVDMELPLIPVITRMEETGIKTDREYLEEKKKELSEAVVSLEESIFKTAGEEFNLNSPKQLQDILFNKLGIEPVKKTKTGYSTDSSVLEKLKEDHPVASEILKYREYKKLISSFIKPILKMSAGDGFIHTSFEQSYAATGRFSSKSPNLQNIPPVIRKGFIPSKSSRQFISMDYSQIELRILAYLSKDENLLEAFNNDRDIHNETAMRIFDIEENEVDSRKRNTAKIINFSVIYGKTPYGLSQELNIPREEASRFIEKYFNDFPGVKDWIEDIKHSAEENGYVETHFGRRRTLKRINSSNRTVKKHEERIAVNTPIQGTAADIIKIAMKRIDEYIRDAGEDIDMILTIHDELLFETETDIAEKTVNRIEELMRDIEPFEELLKVNVKKGKNWFECK
ncbi:MAG: DNA polymerase [bacterium]